MPSMPPWPPYSDGGIVQHRALLALRGDQPDGADLFGHQHAAVGQESHAPGQIEGRHLGHVEGQAGLRLLVAGIDLRARRDVDATVSNNAAFAKIFIGLFPFLVTLE